MSRCTPIAALVALAIAAGCETSDDASPGETASGSLTAGASDGSSDTRGATNDSVGATDSTTSGATDEAGSLSADSGSDDGGATGALEIVGCEPVGAVDTDGVFSMLSFGGALVVGQFGYGQEQASMQYAYPPWHKVEPGLRGIGESVCALAEFGGWLYANTENSGDIMRSQDGQSWVTVHDGAAGAIGCDLVAHDGHLYAVNYNYDSQDHGQILRSADGVAWAPVYDSGPGTSRYLREIATFKGQLLAFSVDTSTSQGYVHRSMDGLDWSEAPTPTRFFRSHVWDGDLWLSSTERSSNGAAGVWRSDGVSFEQVYSATQPYVTELTHWRGALFAATSAGWKDDVGNASVLMSADGDAWETVCPQLPELAAWSLAVHDDRLFVGTWEFDVGGSVYEVVAASDSE